MFEAMVLAQKPKAGTFVENYAAYETGLIVVKASLDCNAPLTLTLAEKPDKAYGNGHLTVKPVQLVKHLIQLLSRPGQVVLDPFLGSAYDGV